VLSDPGSARLRMSRIISDAVTALRKAAGVGELTVATHLL